MPGYILYIYIYIHNDIHNVLVWLWSPDTQPPSCTPQCTQQSAWMFTYHSLAFVALVISGEFKRATATMLNMGTPAAQNVRIPRFVPSRLPTDIATSDESWCWFGLRRLVLRPVQSSLFGVSVPVIRQGSSQRSCAQV